MADPTHQRENPDINTLPCPWPGWNFAYNHYSQSPMVSSSGYYNLDSRLESYRLHKVYSYRIKIINPSKKTTFVIRDFHRFHGKFDSIVSMKVKIIEEFRELVPQTLEFRVGYFLGKQSTKYWIMCEEDLNAMYKSLDEDDKGNVLLWCDGRSSTSKDCETQAVATSRKRKAAADHLVDKRQERLDDLDDIFKCLKEKHGSDYTNPQLRLWARMIEAGNHESTDDPPKIPAITGAIPKKKKDSFAEVLSNAAVTLAQAIKPADITVSGANSSLVVNQTTPPKPLQTTSNVSGNGGNGISPGRTTELRIKKLQELRELQQLLEENVISKEEFSEQKALVLNSLRKLIH